MRDRLWRSLITRLACWTQPARCDGEAMGDDDIEMALCSEGFGQAVRDILDRAGLDSFKEPPHVRYYCGTYRVCFCGGRWYVTNGNQFVKFVKNKDRGIKYCAERCGWVL